VDLNETLQNTVVVAQGEWKHVAEVRLDLAPDLPKVSACAGEMNQVFLNLVVNAAHAILEKTSVQPGHMGRITLTTRVRDTWIEVLVADTGAGIPDTIRDRIFLPFFTTKAVGKGTGQGLSIAHSVITKSGGTIEYESVAGEGTRFIVRLPALPLAEAGSGVTNGNN
jgi:two-component system, NtrC family, sensor kinase